MTPVINGKVNKALSDIQEICSVHEIKYCIVGSIALMGALNYFVRIPHDVDIVYDINQRIKLSKALLNKGYRKSLIDDPLNIFIPPFEHYEKGGKIIETAAVAFTSKGMEFVFPLPILLPKRWRPNINLVMSKTMSKTRVYKFNNISFPGLSKEAQWIHLKMFAGKLGSLDRKKEQRDNDLTLLSKSLDWGIINQIINERPGLYYKNIPLVTLKRGELLTLGRLLFKAQRTFS